MTDPAREPCADGSHRDAHSILAELVRRTVRGHKRARYLDLISRPNSRPKFLAVIHHELEWEIDRTRALPTLPDALLDLPAYCYAPRRDFGSPLSSLREVVESAEDSLIAIARDGSAALLRPEDWRSDPICFHWGAVRRR